MHTIINIAVFSSVFLVLLSSCETSTIPDHAEDEWTTVSMSTEHQDFLKFIVKNPSSLHFDEAVSQYFHYRDLLWDSLPPPPWDCFGNCAKVEINPLGQIQFEYEETDIDSLRIRAFEFITNDFSNGGPEFKYTDDPTGQTRIISKGLFVITFKPDSCPNLQQVVISLSNALEDYKRSLAKSWYESDYKELDMERKNYLDHLLSIRMVFWRYQKPLPPPPLEATVVDPFSKNE